MLYLTGSGLVAVVSFGGVLEGYGWENRLATLDVEALCLSDAKGRWYLDGCDGCGSADEMLDAIGAFFEKRPGHEWLMIGQSAGGYAALRYADQFNAGAVVFAPQTHQFWTNVGPGLTQITMPIDVPDIRGDLLFRSRTKPIHVVISTSESGNTDGRAWGDRIHVAGLEQLENFHVHRVEHDKHAVAFHLARSGLLDDYLLLGIKPE